MPGLGPTGPSTAIKRRIPGINRGKVAQRLLESPIVDEANKFLGALSSEKNVEHQYEALSEQARIADETVRAFKTERRKAIRAAETKRRELIQESLRQAEAIRESLKAVTEIETGGPSIIASANLTGREDQLSSQHGIARNAARDGHPLDAVGATEFCISNHDALDDANPCNLEGSTRRRETVMESSGTDPKVVVQESLVADELLRIASVNIIHADTRFDSLLESAKRANDNGEPWHVLCLQDTYEDLPTFSDLYDIWYLSLGKDPSAPDEPIPKRSVAFLVHKDLNWNKNAHWIEGSFRGLAATAELEVSGDTLAIHNVYNRHLKVNFAELLNKTETSHDIWCGDLNVYLPDICRKQDIAKFIANAKKGEEKTQCTRAKTEGQRLNQLIHARDLNIFNDPGTMTWSRGHKNKTVKTVLLRKDREKKPHDWEPKSYRPIALESCVAKIIDQVMGKRLKEFSEKSKVFPFLQFGTPGTDTTKAIQCIVNQVHSGWLNELKSTLQGFDVQGAYSAVDRIKLLRRLIEKGVPDYLVLCIGSFLTDRRVFLDLPGHEREKEFWVNT